jgi:signal transduction histidine kinase
MIETCSHKMDKMISNLQEYMENCRHRVMPEDIDPNEIIQKAASDFKNQLDTFKIDLIVDTSAGVSWHMDKYVALRILKHLISNSLAFHDPEKKERKITVRVESNERGSILEVSDNGKGIPGDQQANIFEVFFRGTDNSIGLGMGLFLAKGLAEKMGGIITGKSVVDESTSILVSFQGNSFT